MRAPFFFFGIVGLASVLVTRGQTIDVNPNTLDGWTVTGTDETVLKANPALTLPPGSQLSRVFQAGDLSVDAVTQPVLGVAAQDWPMLELGPAALVFARKGASGQLILVVASDAPVALPLTIALDAEGRSAEPVAVNMTVTGGLLTVTSGDQIWQFPIKAEASASQEVVASAGADHAWAFDSLRIDGAAVPVTDTGGFGAGSGAKPQSSADSSSPGSRPSAKASGRVFPANDFDSPASAPPKAAAPRASPPPKTLEVFTPPAVRHGRADAVRATLSQGGNP